MEFWNEMHQLLEGEDLREEKFILGKLGDNEGLDPLGNTETHLK